MDANVLLEKLEPIFDTYQRSSQIRRRSGVLEQVVAEIYQACDEYSTAACETSEEQVLTCLSEVLLHFFDCSFALDYSNDSKDSIDAIFELLASVASEHSLLVEELLGRAVEFTVVLSDKVRSTACHFISQLVSFLINPRSKIPKGEREAFLDQASQSLIPRFTDKVQLVRLACIQAASSFFHSNPVVFTNQSDTVSQPLEDDPDLREALQWSIQHDPSVTNRVAAIESLPATVQTSDHIIARLRDEKEKVRIAAIEKLSSLNVTQLDAEQAAAIVEVGAFSRCEPTKEKTTELIRVNWMKEFNFNPILLLKQIDIVQHEDACEKIVKILHSADKQNLASVLSKNDFQAYWDELESAGSGLLGRSQHREIDLSQLFYTRVRCQCLSESKTSVEKEGFLAPILPDIPTLCEVFELHAVALIKVIVDESQTTIQQNEEEMTSVCLNLLLLFEMVDFEEGARLHLKGTMMRMLQAVTTPEDLVEGCAKALRHVVGNNEKDFWDVSLTVLDSLKRDDLPADVETSRSLRVLSLISVVCEISSPRLSYASSVLERFSSEVFSGLSDDEELVRQAAVGCLGRIGLFASPKSLSENYLQACIDVLNNEDESLEIRAQAMLALSDWTLIRPELSGSIESLQTAISCFMSHDDISVACTAAEVALRLLFARKLTDSALLANLVFLFFDPRLSERSEEGEVESEDVTEIGAPGRMQQLLSLFFPAFCLRTDNDGREAFVACVGKLLEICQKKEGQKRRRESKALPVATMLDYILSTAQPDPEENKSPTEAPRLALTMALQVSQFICHNHVDFTKTFTRTLSKYLGKVYLEGDPLQQDKQRLVMLMDNLETIGMELTDETSLQSLENLNGAVAELIHTAEQPRVSIERDGANIQKCVDEVETTVVGEKENQSENIDSALEGESRRTRQVLA